MKRTLLVVCLMLTACAHRMNTTDLSPGMTQQEVVQRLGKPASALMVNGEQQFIFKIHDDAYGRNENLYALAFKGDRLSSVILLPEDQQEDRGGLVDRALRRPMINIQ
jgi:hypothetical protein